MSRSCHARRTASIVSVLALTAGLLFASTQPSDAFQIQQNQVVSASPVSWTPQILDGKVEAIVQVGNRMIAGGSFTQAQNATGGTIYARSNILAFNATTGVIDMAFAPNVAGEITSMVVAPDGSIVIGGAFSTVNGTTVTKIAKLNPVTGALVPGFVAKASAKVNDLALWGNEIVVGGAFKKINGVARTSLAVIDGATGAVQPTLNLAISGVFNGGSTTVLKLDISPDGSKLMIVGNFITIHDQSRVQIAMIDLTTNPASLAGWQTDAYSSSCSSLFKTYMRDVEFAPDGSYFVVAAAGAGYWPTTFCDTATRWESDATGTDLGPTWAAYSGGDTFTAIAVTGTAIYAGGHMRWMNNDAVGDVAAAGAIVREGLAALDPQNGMPLHWNPTRARGSGVFAFLATPTGLWIGHDTKTVAHQTHSRVAFFPLAGGTKVPVGVNATIPGTLYNTARSICPGTDTSVLYRVNAGGPAIAPNDCGPAWEADQTDPSPYRNDGSNTAEWSLGAGVTSSVPDGTPRTIFDTERWSPSDNPAMNWAFPVPAGTHVQVRLYFSNGYDGTSQPGQRIFDVAIDGSPVLANYDIIAEVGNKIGTMEPFDVTSDGTVNIDFSHVVENPLINGIEIVDLDAPPMPQFAYCVDTDTSVLYRVDAGGPDLAPTDCGPTWAADETDPSPYRNDGSNLGGPWDPVIGVSNAIANPVPLDLFRTERWSPSDNPAMNWAFPVPAGTHVRVRLYFANGYSGTSQPGQRVFNVSIDGSPALSNYDIVADVGDRIGTMESFGITSDGTVNIDLLHVVENPLINGIEIVDLDAPPGPQPLSSAEFLGRRSFDGSTLGPDDALNTGGTDWANAAGAFYLNGKIYAGWSDGGLYSWTFDGSSLGPRVDVLEQGNYVYGRTWTSFTDVTGMFWLDGRLYYTRSGDPHLFYRYFTPASELVGSIQYVASGPGVDALDWSTVEGMTEASNEIYFATTDGNLHRIDVANGGPVQGTDAVIGGPGIDGRDWRTNAMFIAPTVTPDTTPPAVPGKPVGASHSSSSIDLTWGASTDDVSSTITYDVFRDGGSTPVGQVVSSSTGTVSFTETGLSPGTTHTYSVDAVDEAGNPSAKSPPSDPITVLTANPPIFADTFGSGDCSAWTSNTRMTIDTSQGGAAAPSARMNTTAQSASAYKDLAATYTSICVSANVNVAAQNGSGLDLLRLRAPGNGAAAKVFLTAAGKLAIRSDFASAQKVSAASMPSGWHDIELCGSAGMSQAWDLYLDGTKVVDGWLANTGSTGFARIQIGDTAAKTIVANWDDVEVDQQPG